MKKTLFTALALCSGCAMATQTTFVDLSTSYERTANGLSYENQSNTTGVISSNAGANFGTVDGTRIITNVSFMLNLDALSNLSGKGNYTLMGLEGSGMTYLGICVNNQSNTIYTKWGTGNRTTTLKFKDAGDAVNPSFSDFETVVHNGVNYALVNVTLNGDGGTTIWKDADNYWVDSGLKAGSGYTDLKINNISLVGAITINSVGSNPLANNWAPLAANADLVKSFTATPLDPAPALTETAVANACYADGRVTFQVADDLSAFAVPGADLPLNVTVSEEVLAALIAEMGPDALSLVKISLTDGDLPGNGVLPLSAGGNTINLEDYAGRVTFNGSYVGEVGADGKVAYKLSYIPEPTTATLSLLALAGLAARRRRKH